MEIERLTLQTKSIREMKEFYVDTFGFPLVMEDENRFRIQAGSSELEFTTENVKGDPYYHFAFNIFANKFEEAKSWVKERVPLNENEGEDEVYFSYSDAHALYFYDPAGNVVEFISRHSISERGEGPFSVEDVLNISEIGLTVEDVVTVGNRLIEIGIHERDDKPISITSLNFMGEKSKGIFIILNKPGRQWFFSDKISAVYPLEITTSNQYRISVDSNKVDVYRK
ncbi:VOC family protein [Oceanobacillus luteolus]|uniref:VOC family protein n=1 Tax=Oceanobacillus luteolus TaxID=1274358 RepID=UPI00203EA511|nr:VOC family protein [Oceanobacillus luteolus]MCM3741362.1 VOC family protein [Oceanobacillus luteolus]